MGVDLTQSATYSLSSGDKAIWSFIGVTAKDVDSKKMRPTDQGW